MNKGVKICYIAFCLAITIATIGTWSANRLFPVLPATIVLTTSVIAIYQFYAKTFSLHYLVAYTTLSVFYRVYSYLLPTGFIGKDSDKYAFAVVKLLINHRLEVIELGFYPDAPLFLISGAVSTTLTDTTVKTGLVVVPLVVGIMFPLVAFLLPRYLEVPYGTELSYLAAAITVMAPSSVALTTNPVPQSQAVIVALTGMLLLGLYTLTGRRIFSVLTLLCFFTILWTHKLSPYLITAGLAIAILLMATRRLLGRRGTGFGDLEVIGGVMLVFLYLQIYVTSILEIVFKFYLFRSQLIESEPIQPISTSPVAEAVYRSGVSLFLMKSGYLVLLLFFAGIGWLYLLRRGRDHSMTVFVLGVTAVGTGLTLSSGQPINIVDGSKFRFFLLVTPIASILCGMTLLLVRDASYGWRAFRQLFIVVMLVGLFVGQGFAPAANPDHDIDPRSYLTPAENAAKNWGYARVQGNVLTDPRNAGKLPPSQMKPSVREGSDNPWPDKYQAGVQVLLSGAVPENELCMMLVRPEKQIYFSEERWKPTVRLDEAYLRNHRVYSSGERGGVYVRFSQCSTK